MAKTGPRMFLDATRKFPSARAWNIATRTVHIGVTGVLLGGHVFGAAREQLYWWLYLSIGTGVVLIVLEAYPNARWLHQLRGLAVCAKILLLGLVPVCWPQRVYLLGLVVVIASVGSHMPGRFRYYSVLYRRVLDD